MNTFHWKPRNNNKTLVEYLKNYISTDYCLLIKDKGKQGESLETLILNLKSPPIKVATIIEDFYGGGFYLDKTGEGLEGLSENREAAITITPYIVKDHLYWDLYQDLEEASEELKLDRKGTFKKIIKGVFNYYNLPTESLEFSFTNPTNQLKVYKGRSELILLRVDTFNITDKSQWELKIVPKNIYLTLNK